MGKYFNLDLAAPQGAAVGQGVGGGEAEAGPAVVAAAHQVEGALRVGVAVALAQDAGPDGAAAAVAPQAGLACERGMSQSFSHKQDADKCSNS